MSGKWYCKAAVEAVYVYTGGNSAQGRVGSSALKGKGNVRVTGETPVKAAQAKRAVPANTKLEFFEPLAAFTGLKPPTTGGGFPR